MINPIDYPIPTALQQQRQLWFIAYQQKDIQTMGDIETKNFFAVYYQNVEKKAEWHKNVTISAENDPVLALLTNKNLVKVDNDQINENSYVITSYIKGNNQSVLLKEMWERQNQGWQISSLSINEIRLDV